MLGTEEAESSRELSEHDLQHQRAGLRLVLYLYCLPGRGVLLVLVAVTAVEAFSHP